MTPSPPRQLAADGALLLITAIWGATFVTVKDALAGADAFTFLALRFTLGAASAALVAGRALLDARVWRRGAVLGALLFGGYALQTVGLEHTSPARSAFITGLTVLFVPVVSWRLSRQRPPGAVLVGAALAVAGLQQLTGFSWRAALPLGDLLTLGCAAVYGVHIAATSHLGRGVPPMALVAVQLLVTAALSAACLPLVERRFEPTPAFWAAVALTGLLASTFAIGVQVWAQARVAATRAAVIYALEPLFAVLWGAAWGQGWPDRGEWLGGALIVAGVLVAELGPARRAGA